VSEASSPGPGNRPISLSHEGSNTGDDEGTETGLSLVGSSGGHGDGLSRHDLGRSLGLGCGLRGLLGSWRSGSRGLGSGSRGLGSRSRGLGLRGRRLGLGSRGQRLRSSRGGNNRGKSGGDGARAVCVRSAHSS
jgi:hypothetical protein